MIHSTHLSGTEKIDQDRRRSERKKTSFWVVINELHFDGFDVSLEGFSFYVPGGNLLFLEGQKVKNITILSSEIQHGIELAEIASYRQLNRGAVYGMRILSITNASKIGHVALFKHNYPPLKKHHPNFYKLGQVEAVVSELILACENEGFDDCEFRSLAKTHLHLLKELI